MLGVIEKLIELKDVSVEYKKGKLALSNINIKIEKGEFVFVVGSSGAGKSTFMKLLLKEIEPTEGKIIINKKEITRLPKRKIPYLRRSMGVVFQDFRLLLNKTAYENVAFAMEILGYKDKVVRRTAPIALGMVGLADKGNSYPNELSGGEQQRVSIARALVNNPEILIADEPTGNLDPQNAWDIMKYLEEINKKGTTVIVVTHAHELVNHMRKRVIVLEDGRLLSDTERGYYSNV